MREDQRLDHQARAHAPTSSRPTININTPSFGRPLISSSLESTYSLDVIRCPSYDCDFVPTDMIVILAGTGRRGVLFPLSLSPLESAQSSIPSANNDETAINH